jgi:hypothetical protein
MVWMVVECIGPVLFRKPSTFLMGKGVFKVRKISL